MCIEHSYEGGPRQTTNKLIQDEVIDASSKCHANIENLGLGRIRVYNEAASINIQPKYNPQGAGISGSISREYVPLEDLREEIINALTE